MKYHIEYYSWSRGWSLLCESTERTGFAMRPVVFTRHEAEAQVAAMVRVGWCPDELRVAENTGEEHPCEYRTGTGTDSA